MGILDKILGNNKEDNFSDLINKLENLIAKADKSGDKNEFIDPAYDIIEKIEEKQNSFDAVKPILDLIERSPDIDYGGPGPLGSFLETFYNNSEYENLLETSVRQKPKAFNVFLLDRIIADKKNKKRDVYIQLLNETNLKTDLSNETKEYLNFAIEKNEKL